MEPKGWELFESCFKEGDEVVVIDEDDRFHWGRMTFDKQGLGFALYNPYKAVAFLWDDVRFMAHDGFPIRKLLGADGSRTIELLDTLNTQESIREALSIEFPQKIISARLGDPFDIEGVVARLYHAGNSGLSYWNRFYNSLLQKYHSEAHREAGWEREEVIVMESKDGAKAELWDLTTVYMFECA